MKASALVPLDKIGEVTDRIIIDPEQLAMPDWMPAHTMQLDVKRMESIAHWGGFGSIAIVGYYGDMSSFTPSIAGMDGQGNAVAANQVTAKKADLATHELTDNSDITLKTLDYDRPDVTVRINQAEIDQHVANANGNLRDVELRARHMNKGLRRELSEAVLGNELTPLKIMLGAVPSLIVAAHQLLDGSPGFDTADAAQRYANGVAFYLMSSAYLDKFAYGHDLRDRKWSVLPGIGVPLDRVAIAQAQIHRGKLLKPATSQD